MNEPFDLAKFLQTYQTALVGVIGFTGVIATLIVNAWIARSGRAEARLHDRETLLCGLITELQVSLAAYEDAATELAIEGRSNFYNIPIYSMSKIFEANLSKLGLLSAQTLRRTLDAYLGIQQLHNILLIHGNLVNEGRAVALPAQAGPRVSKSYAWLVGAIKAAISALEADLRDISKS